MIGNVYHKLTVISAYGKYKGALTYLCKCECGANKVARGNMLRLGKVKSCGCYRSERARTNLVKMNTGDGRTNHRLYKIWAAMLFRCYNPKSMAYKNYGGRGITVCDEWCNDFWKFVQDVGMPPTYSHSIDRKNNNGTYTKNNCKWSTSEEQQNNRRCNVNAL